MLRLKTAQTGMKLAHLSWSITWRKARVMQMQQQLQIRKQAGRLGDEAGLVCRRDERLLGMEQNCRSQQIMDHTARSNGVYELVMMDIVSRCSALHLEGCWLARIGAESPCVDADAVMGAFLSLRLREPLLLAVWSSSRVALLLPSSSNSACIIRHTIHVPCPSRTAT